MAAVTEVAGMAAAMVEETAAVVTAVEVMVAEVRAAGGTVAVPTVTAAVG